MVYSGKYFPADPKFVLEQLYNANFSWRNDSCVSTDTKCKLSSVQIH